MTKIAFLREWASKHSFSCNYDADMDGDDIENCDCDIKLRTRLIDFVEAFDAYHHAAHCATMAYYANEATQNAMYALEAARRELDEEEG